jgi:hypothetical protein
MAIPIAADKVIGNVGETIMPNGKGRRSIAASFTITSCRISPEGKIAGTIKCEGKISSNIFDNRGQLIFTSIGQPGTLCIWFRCIIGDFYVGRRTDIWCCSSSL